MKEENRLVDGGKEMSAVFRGARKCVDEDLNATQDSEAARTTNPDAPSRTTAAMQQLYQASASMQVYRRLSYGGAGQRSQPVQTV